MKTISDHILDIVQNSINAKAELIEIIVHESDKTELCTLTITDDGCGMDAETLKHAIDPFFTTGKTKKVGLGLSLLKQNALRSGGDFQIFSDMGKGTKVVASFGLTNPDKPPLGNIGDMFYLTMQGNPKINFRYAHSTKNGEFTVSSAEIIEMTEGVSLHDKLIREAIIDLINNNIRDLEQNETFQL